ncbi:MAG: hypothetical protein Q9224_006839, partial [Gallowayella concinna]
RACARRDVSVGFSSSSRQTPLMTTSGGVSSDSRLVTRMSSAPVTTSNSQAALFSVSVITAVDDQLHSECIIDSSTEVNCLGGSGGDGEHNDDNDEPPGASARYGSQDRSAKVTNRNRQRLVARARKRDRRQRRVSPERRKGVQDDSMDDGGNKNDTGIVTEKPMSTQQSSSSSEGEDHGTRLAAAEGWLAQELKDRNARVSEGQQIHPTPRARNDMVRTALMVGGPAALKELQEILHQQRATGSLRSLSAYATPAPEGDDDPAARRSLVIPQPQPQAVSTSHLHLHPDLRDFCRVWGQVDQLRVSDMLQSMVYRLQLAQLAGAYDRAIARAHPRSGDGLTQASQAKLSIFKIVFPQWSQVERPRRNPCGARSDWKKFSRRLEFSRRWSLLQRGLGQGIFGVMPTSILPHKLIEQTFRTGELELWVDLVTRFNPAAIQVGEKAFPILQNILRGQRLSAKPWRLERTVRAEIGAQPDPLLLLDEAEGFITSADEEG